MVRIRDIDRLTRREGTILTIPPGCSAAEAARKMQTHRVGCLVVAGTDGRMAGIISERDIITKVVAEGRDPRTVLAGQIMTASVISCSMGTQVSQAQRIMSFHGIRHLPIVDDGNPVGMLSQRDVLAHQLAVAEAVVREQERRIEELEGKGPRQTSAQVEAAALSGPMRVP